MKNLAYLADISKKLNGFKLKLQEKGTNIIDLRNKVIVFYSKSQNWRRKVMQGNTAMFENLSSAIKEDEELDKLLTFNHLLTFKTQHLQSLEAKYKQYFPKVKKQEAVIVRNPFSIALNVDDIFR